jgi:hypothetical protein
MRFCHVSTFYPPYHFGGDAILTQSICEGLARRGHDVTVVHAAEAYELLGDQVSTAPVDPPGITRHALRSRMGTLSPILVVVRASASVSRLRVSNHSSFSRRSCGASAWSQLGPQR